MPLPALGKFIRDLFRPEEDGPPPGPPTPVAVVHQGDDGKWYLKVGYRLENDFDTKLVSSIEEASEDRSMMVAMARELCQVARIVIRPAPPAEPEPEPEPGPGD